MYNANATVNKKCNVEQQLMTMHKDYVSKYADNREIRRDKFENLKRNSRQRQATFSKPFDKGRAAAIASYKKHTDLDYKDEAV